ncbi:MAG: vitamin B12 dependent methionine synthase [Slackia sp.]|nr:vitamin B12 dependent methionine synthase [Slackia sp.]
MPVYRVNKAEALRYLGYAGQATDGLLDDRIDELIESCERLSKPDFLYRIFPVEETEEGVRLVGSSLLLEGDDIRAHLHGARECAVMACTLGLANEVAAQRMKAKGALDALVFGAAGSSLVECAADACEAAIVADGARRGLHTNWRFSPGYGDLPLSIQPAIVRALSADKKLGITVTKSDLLIPVKSVTAFVGLFDEPRAHTKRTCAGCACAAHCSLRKAGNPCYR